MVWRTLARQSHGVTIQLQVQAQLELEASSTHFQPNLRTPSDMLMLHYGLINEFSFFTSSQCQVA